MNRAWAEISLSALSQNYRALSRLAGEGALVAPVVKADAYGHGLIPVARAVLAVGAPCLAVATLDEALTLRRAGVSATLYTLSPLLPDEAEETVRADVTPFISSPEFYEAFWLAAQKAPLPARYWLALDSGMGREGMSLADAQNLPDSPSLVRAGISTHLSSADEDDLDPTEDQLATFAEQVRILDPSGRLPLSWANSPAFLRRQVGNLSGRAGNLFRPGAALYGIEPYPGSFAGLGLRPALALRASVTLIRELPAGATVGYGRTFTADKPCRIATIGIGYGDGLSRELSNRGQVLVRGQRCPLVGRVSMDQCQIDVTELPEVRIGDVATLIGRDGEEELTAAEVAELARTTCHAPTTMLTRRVERRYA